VFFFPKPLESIILVGKKRNKKKAYA